jgi:hypothetical protein
MFGIPVFSFPAGFPAQSRQPGSKAKVVVGNTHPAEYLRRTVDPAPSASEQ